MVSPVADDLQGVARLAAETPRQVANANTIFNIANTCILIWFTGPIATLATKLVPQRANAKKDPKHSTLLDPIYLQTPSLALDRVSLEMANLGEHVANMLDANPLRGRRWIEGRSQPIDGNGRRCGRSLSGDNRLPFAKSAERN